MAAQYKMKPAKVRKQLDRGDQMQAVRSDVRKSKALEWLVEHVDLVDEAGNTIDRSDLDIAELIRPADTVDSTAEPTTDAPDEEPEA